MAYRIGIDVGENSVGLAAIEYSADGKPLRILAALSHIHDGGMMPGSAKSPISRLAAAGVGRRTRRLVRNRRKRLIALDALLRQHGYPPTEPADGITYQQWRARAELLQGFVDDEPYRRELLALAIRHIARHRGWRNPWWTYERLASELTPSESMEKMSADAALRLGVPAEAVRFVGQIGALSASRNTPLRPRTREGSLAKAPDVNAMLSQQVKQVDQFAELREIFEVQRIEPVLADAMLRAVFSQETASVPVERIGRDALPGMKAFVRAPVAALEFQEYRIRSVVANLRVQQGRETRSLEAAEHDQVVAFLFECRDEPPVWADIAELLGVSARNLRKPTADDEGAGSRAPIDRTSKAIEAKFPAKSTFGSWWRSADAEHRADVVRWLIDGAAQPGDADSLVEVVDDVEVREKFDALDLTSGRAAYSIPSLKRMNEYMAKHRCDAHTARRECFDIPDDWQPPRPRLEDAIEHPTVDRVVTIVRRFLVNAVQQWGVPESVAVEHVRGSFMGPSALAEYKFELRTNERRNEAQREELRKAGVAEPRRADVRRYQAVRQQNGKCLYCGDAISFDTCELDHIVPSKLGGSNQSENLVAVCRLCNQDKSHTPFAVWAASKGDSRISVHAAQERLREWDRAGRSVPQSRALRAAVSRRLAATSDEDFPDERSLASTAYAAREVRFRIESFLAEEAAKQGVEVPPVQVFRGTMTSEARKAGGVDSMLRLRGAEAKSRFDRRHHAIDAAVLTTITPSVAQTMGIRHRMRISNEFAGDADTWKAFEGVDAGHTASWHGWRECTGALAGLLVTAVADDAVPVTRSLRLTPRFGEIHAATVRPLKAKPVNDVWTANDVSRIADFRVRRAFTELLISKRLSEPSALNSVLPSETTSVAMFDKDSAQILLRGGSAEIGTSVHHARVYAWRTKRGEINFGYVRVFAGEFPLIGFTGKTDVLTAPIPMWSQSMLKANETLFGRIVSGEAVEIGWLAVDDEIEFDPSSLNFGTDKFGRLMSESAERHWLVTGFFDDTKLSLTPALLASEGLGESQGEALKLVLTANRLPLAVNGTLSLPSCTIVRRTALGRPRWISAHLPVSWQPREVAEARLRR